MKKFNLTIMAIVATMMMVAVATANGCDFSLHTGGTTMSVDGASGVTAYNFSGWDTGMKYNGVGITSGASGVLKTTGYKRGCNVDSVANGSGVFKAKSSGVIGAVIGSGDLRGSRGNISGISLQGAGVAGRYSTSSVVKVSGRTTLR